MKRLLNRIAIVTGAAQGIGLEISKALARQGATVILTDISERVRDEAFELLRDGFEAESFNMDVTNTEEINGVVDNVLKKHGKIDILVNNAGIYPRKKLVDMSEEFFFQMFDVNVFGMFRCAKAVLSSMMEKRYGKIINISSVTGPMVGTSTGGQTAYGSTKAAVHGFTVALALEVARYGITVNCVYPGFIHTSSAYKPTEVVSNEYAEEIMKKFGLSLPMGRQGSPQDVSNAVLFLASDESNYITGTGIVIDGGAIRACTHPND